jgi:hypothetical protein
LPFLPLFDFVIGATSVQTLSSSHLARSGHLTFCVMGDKGGKIAARNGNDVATDGTVRGKSGKVRQGYGHVHVLARPPHWSLG